MSKVIDSSTTRLKRLELSARIALAMDHLLPNHISSTGAIYRPRLPTKLDEIKNFHIEAHLGPVASSSSAVPFDGRPARAASILGDHRR